MATEIYLFSKSIKLPAFHISDAAEKKIVGFKLVDAGAYDTCFSIMERLLHSVLAMLHDDSLKNVHPEIIKWWKSEVDVILELSLRGVQMDFERGAPQALFNLTTVGSKRA